MRKHFLKSILSVIIILATVVGVFPTFTFAADSFETSISAFPESYKPYLRALHEEHPKWVFEALNTGLDWTDAVNAESLYNRSLVTNSSAYTDIFKSREASDYNASTGTFIQKDSGFVSANKLAISYFMDPRNFLDEKGIFQFEKLSFDSSITVSEVETILKGSFMENTNIVYLNSDGDKKTIKKKYSEVIYNAGKEYNVNPCFLASKIINEVGRGGTSTSVAGNNSKYPGIYNYFNIGAYDGANASVNGLKWASNKSNGYGTPWNTPEKAIKGGAQYNAEKYISKGQDTNYLQKFNVNPKSSYKTYDHQYMTNLAGVSHPAYLTYKSLVENKLIDNKYIFLIPVYKNMPGEKQSTGTVVVADSKNQVGTVTTGCNVRTGPSTQSSSLGFTLPSGSSVTVLDTVFTDATDPDLINRYPFWAKIKFTYSSKSYTGYVYSNFVNLKTTTTVQKGSSYSPVQFRTNKYLELRYISLDPSIAAIENDTTIKFLKTGTVDIIAYDSLMHYQVLRYKVVKSTDDLTISGVKASSIKDTSFKVSFTKNSNYTKYEIYVVNSNGKLIKSSTTTDNSAVISDLDVNTSYKVYVRGLKSNSYSPFSSAVSVKTSFSEAIDNVSGLSASNSNYKSVKLAWNAVSGAQGYKVYTYNKSTKKYTLLKDVGNKTAYTDTSANAINTTYYSVVAYKTVNGKLITSDYSSLCTYKPPVITISKVTSLKQSSATKNSVNLTWKKVANANCYLVYKYSDKDKKYVKVASVTTNSCNVTGLSANKTYKFKVRAVLKLYGEIYYGAYSGVYTAYTALANVKNLNISGVTKTSYKLSWSKVSGAKGYEILKYDPSTKKYVKIKTTTATSYNVSGLKSGTQDTYKVRAYKKSDIGTLRSTAAVVYASTSPAKVTGLKASDITKNSLKLSWKKVSGATAYLVYKYSDKDKKYVKIASVTKNSLNVTELSASKTYQFKVRAVVKTNSKNYYGAYSDVYTAYTAPGDVKNLKISNVVMKSYTLSWKKVSGAKGYEIFRLDPSTKKYVKLATTSETSYKVSGLSAGTSDIYKVRAYKKTEVGTLRGKATEYYASTAPSKPTKLSASDVTESSATLSWKEVSNAYGYVVYELNPKTNELEKVGKTSKTSLNLKNLSSGKSYTYIVKAYCKTNSINTYSAESASLKIKTK